MYKKALAVVIIMAMGMTGFAKSNEEELLSVEQAKSIAKEEANNKTADFLSKMKNKLANIKGEKDPDFKKAKNVEDVDLAQFLYQNDLISPNLGITDINLKKVYNKLKKKQNTPTSITYTTPQIGAAQFKKTIETKGKNQGKEKIDSTKLIIPANFEVHAIAKDGISNVKYLVRMEWEVDVTADKEKVKINGKKQNVIKGYKKVKGSKLYSVSAKHIKYLSSDKADMGKAAEMAIQEWYANLPQTLDKKYSNQSISSINPLKVSSKDIKIATPNTQNFKVTNVPEITIDIDPYQFINKDSTDLYTNPKASLVVKPEFNINVADNFKTAEISSVLYTVIATNKPISDKEKVERYYKSKVVINDLSTQLSEYVASRDNNQKTTLIEMFETAENDVEVSYMPKRGGEKIKSRTAKKYLSRLKGEELSINVDDCEIAGDNLETIIYTVSQEYQGKHYSDYTQKRIHLKYDPTKGSYFIHKIEVVPNSTQIK